MNILLKGYFDRNFGDDVMQQILIEGMPEHSFYIRHSQKELFLHLAALSNVTVCEETPHIDALVNITGTGFMFKTRLSVLNGLSDLMHKEKYSKSAVVNCSLEPYTNAPSKFVGKHTLNKYGFVSCRDAISYNSLKKSLRHTQIVMNPDILFGLPQSRIYPKTGENLLGIVPVRRIYSAENFNYYKKLTDIADKYIDKTGCEVILFAFDCEKENDIAAVQLIYEMMKNKTNAKICIHSGNGDSIFREYARCSSIISSRFHGTVLALKYDIPVVSISDTEKLNRLCSDFDLRCFNKADFSADCLSEYILSNPSAAILPEEIEKSAMKHIADLKEYLLS